MNALHTMHAVGLALGFSGCAHGLPLDARVRELREVAHEARERGAYRCAPEELARAEAELEFAHSELGFGDPARAEEHLVRAAANVRAAVRLRADPSCREAPSTSPEARAWGVTTRLSVTQPPLRPGSTKEHAAI